MAAKKQKTVLKTKKKKWVPVHAPTLFNEALLGESFVSDSSVLKGRYITANFSTISRSFRKQNVNIQFKVTDVKDGKAFSRVVGYSLINAAIKRIVRRGRDKIDDSFLLKTKNKEVIRLKPLIITHNKGTKSIQSAVRLETRRFVREYTFAKTTDEIFSDITNGKLQKMIKKAVNTFFPVRSVDIRIAKLDESGGIVVTDKAMDSETVKRRTKSKEGKKHLPEDELAKQKESQENSQEATGQEDVSEDAESDSFGEEDAFESEQESDEPSEDEQSEQEESTADESSTDELSEDDELEEDKKE